QPEEVRKLIENSRVLVNTSRAEGFPNTMLEAWSMGVPVVSLTVDPGGVILREGLGRVSNTLAQLRNDVRTLARNDDLNRAIGRSSLSYVTAMHAERLVCDALVSAAATSVTPQRSLLLANTQISDA